MDSPMIRAIVFATLLGIAGGTEADSHTGFIQGSVSDTGGDPVTNVAVEIVDTSSSSVTASVTTNDRGEFGPVELPPGDYTARVDDPAWNTDSATNVALNTGETQTILVTVESTTGLISGEVNDTSANPVPGVTVEVIDTNASSVVATLTTNDSGEFGPVELPSGDYTARVDDPAWSTASATNVALDTSETQIILVTVEQLTGFIRGTAEDTTGDPVGGVDVEIVNTNTGSVAVTLTTNASGEFGPVEVPAGDYTARIVDAGYDETATSVSLASNETQSIRITAETPAASRPIPATSPWALGFLAFFMAWVIRRRLH